MAKVWKKTEEAVEIGEDTGDILTPLTRNLKRAARHDDAGKPERAAYYHEQAENVIRLINQEG